MLARILWPRDRLWADPTTVYGRATLYSFAYALVRSAAVFLQIDPSELAVGVRPYGVLDDLGESLIGGDVYLYDTLPGGAGYARDISANFEEIVSLTRELTGGCPANCDTACYRCLLDYGNQRHHGLLDRALAVDVAEHLIDGSMPSLGLESERALLDRLTEFAAETAVLQADVRGDLGAYAIVTLSDGRRTVVKPIHTLVVPSRSARLALAHETGIAAILYARAVELQRQPFAVWRHVMEFAR
jgi:hypothetical protein